VSDRLVDTINRSPVTFGVLGLYLLFAMLTDVVSPSREQLIDHGAAVAFLIMDGEPWRLVSHCFLHGGLLHLALNSYALYLFGPVLESRLGSLRFTILYLVAGVTGGIAAVLWQLPVVTLVGGSGALFGMLGAILASNLRSGRNFLEAMRHPGTRTVLILLGINLGLGFLFPLVSNSAHIGGLVGGFIVTFCFLDRGRFRPDATARVIQGGWIALVVSLIFYTMFPVLRWDYNLKLALQSKDPQRAAALEQAAQRTLHPVIHEVQHVVSDFECWDATLERWKKGG